MMRRAEKVKNLQPYRLPDCPPPIILLLLLISACDFSDITGLKGSGTLTSKTGASSKLVDVKKTSGGGLVATVNTDLSQQVVGNAFQDDGFSIVFPQGSLSVPAQVVVARAQSLVTGSNFSELGLESGISATPASHAVTVSSNHGSVSGSDLVQQFQLSIPVSGSSLQLAQSEYAVMYRTQRVASADFILGFASTEDVSTTVADGKAIVSVRSRYFGTFQVVKGALARRTSMFVKSQIPFVTQYQQESLPQVTWNGPTISWNNSSFLLQAQATTSPAVSNCVLSVEDDGGAFIFAKKVTTLDNTVELPKDTNGNLKTRYECVETLGLQTASPWSQTFVAKSTTSGQAIASATPTPTSTATPVPATLNASITTLSTTAYGNSSTATISLNNTGQVSFTATTFSLSNSTDFSVASGTCASGIPPGSSCSATLTFAPKSTGSLSTNITIAGTATSGNVSTSLSSSATGSAGSVTVAALYPTNGANWNDYVTVSSPATSRFSQTDTACAGTESWYSGCMHGGELRKVVLPTFETTCNNLSASDSLGAFNWICSVSSGSAVFHSVGLKEGKGLKDLVQATSWTGNSVTITKGGNTVATSSSTSWWNNTVSAAPSASSSPQSLSTSGTIYTISGANTIKGYLITADKIALVTLSASGLALSTSSSNCNSTNGTATSANQKCIISVGASSGSRLFAWVEVNAKEANGAPASYAGIMFANTSFSRIHESLVSQGSGDGIRLYNSHNNLVIGSHVAYNSVGLYLDTSTKNVVSRLTSSMSGSYGIRVEYSGTSQENVLTRLVLIANTYDGIYSQQFRKNTVHGVTAVLNGNSSSYSALSLGVTYDTTLTQVVAVANKDGISAGNGNNFRGGQFVTYGNAYNEISLGAAGPFALTPATIKENFLWDGSGCLVYSGGGDQPGVTNSTCASQDSSTYSLRNISSPLSSFVGAVTNADSRNQSDTNGSQSFASITDWSHFDNEFRAWGKSGTFGNGISSSCTTGTCRIWDARLKSSDTVLLNRSGDGNNANETWASGSHCPTAVGGSRTITDYQSTANTYLVNSFEVIGDNIGDDNGLCETNEYCIYAPNFGAYQGEGNYFSNGTCTFSDGTVTGVSMMAYPTNGG